MSNLKHEEIILEKLHSSVVIEKMTAFYILVDPVQSTKICKLFNAVWRYICR